MASTAVAASASRKHVELSLELKRKLIQEHEHGVPFTLLGKKYHIATSTAANIWRKKDFFLRSRMSGSRKRCNDRSKYKIVNQVTALFVKSMLERNHKIDGEVIKRFARTAAAQCNFKDFHGSNGWLDSFKKRENVCWVRRRGERSANGVSGSPTAGGAGSPNGEHGRRSDSPNLSAAAAAAAVAATAQPGQHGHRPRPQQASASEASSAAAVAAAAASAPGGHWDSLAEPLGAEHNCARCNVAAAAAAVAALNASDSIHERDHEIEDWFHGIPFLCQFFEDYQSMHSQVNTNNNNNNNNNNNEHQQQAAQVQQAASSGMPGHSVQVSASSSSAAGSVSASVSVSSASTCTSISSATSTSSTCGHGPGQAGGSAHSSSSNLQEQQRQCENGNGSLALAASGAQEAAAGGLCGAPATDNNNSNSNNNSSTNVILQSRSMCDYNSDDQSAEFYQTTSRYIAPDAQSDDLLYHDEVSDHNDCCSDHYDQSGGHELQMQDYQGDLGGARNTCYMDEYEYENISTIRHYPVPMPQTGPAGQVASFSLPDEQVSNGQSQPGQQGDEDANGGFGARLGSQPQQQQQTGCAHIDISGCQSAASTGAGFLSSLASNSNSSAHLAAAAGAGNQQQQDYQQSNGSNATDVDSHYSSLMGLQDYEQSVEHADHEEHNLLHNALMRSPEKLKLIDSIITLLNYASNYNQKMLAPLFEIKRCIERDLEVVLSDTNNGLAAGSANSNCWTGATKTVGLEQQKD